MIPRYTRPAMGRLWEPDAKYGYWLKVELAAAQAMAEKGIVPADEIAVVRVKARFDAERIDEIERTTKHDVIAFLTCVAENVGPEARHLHYGMTSSDVLDTALALQLADAADLLLKDLDELAAVLRRRAFEHKDTVMIGRTHGIHAEPITFGLKLALWYAEMGRNRERLARARASVAVGKLSGAVGTFAHLPPEIEERTMELLGLACEPIAGQVVQRDRHAEFFTTLAVIAASVEKIAVEVRHLQRTEVLEAEEFFSEGQKGSSAMPHKRNPILSENLVGLARLVRGNAVAALENVALWHERDISHSSVERVIGPDSTILVDFMLARLTGLLDKLLVYPDRMKENLDRTRGLVFSQDVLLALTRAGVSREDAYRLVQRHAMRVWKEGTDFKTLLLNDPEIAGRVPAEAIEAAFDPGGHLRHVDALFARVFGGAA
jgi:adenylosuccinate lyase